MVEKVQLEVEPQNFSEEAERFRNWYKTAKPQEWYTYHFGFSLHEGYAVQLVKEEAWEYACDGKVYLFAERDKVDGRFFHFKAQKASKVFPHLNPDREYKRKI